MMIARKRWYFTLPSALEAGVLLYLQGAIIMNPNCIRKPEQIKPISSSLCISEIYLALVYCEVVFSCHFKS
jgi:hypothetical protein